jgi:tyrosyl-tRNA synthetase
MAPILEELEARGLVYDTTDRDELGKLLAGGAVTFYAGYDPSGSSLHLGNLVPISLMARLQRAGHKPIVVVGGATGMIGDPSGKTQERSLQTLHGVERNVAGVEAQLRKYLDFKPPNDAIVANNLTWQPGGRRRDGRVLSDV